MIGNLICVKELRMIEAIIPFEKIINHAGEVLYPITAKKVTADDSE